MVVSKTNNRLTNAARESLKATGAGIRDMAILDEYVLSNLLQIHQFAKYYTDSRK